MINRNKIAEQLFYYFLCPALLLVVLELFLKINNIPPYLLPLPSDTLKALFQYRFILLSNSLATITAIFLGFLVGFFVGSILAVTFFYFEKIEKILTPYIFLTQIFPKISLAPILILWFGFGLSSKVFISGLMSLFPIMVNSITGLRSATNNRVDVFKSLFANRRQMFLKLYLPNAMPHIFPGLKIGVLFSVIGVIVGEFISSDSGLGYLIKTASYQMNLKLCFAALTVLAGVVITFYLVLNIAQYYVLSWQRLDTRNRNVFL